MNRIIPPDAWSSLAQALDVQVSALRAVATVESAGAGFLAPPDERPKILFEGHIFHRLTQGRFSADHPTLSFRKWTRAHYAKTQPLEWQRLERACQLDRPAALQSASWGMFQIMGFNYPLCGFPDIEAFVARQKAGAQEQLETFARFIAREVFLRALRKLDWAAFARQYNGPGYAANQYDTKMAAAYAAIEKLKSVDKPAEAVTLPTATLRRSQPRSPGRSEVVPVPIERRRAKRKPVKPDRVDLRDWVYRPNVTRAPPEWLMPHNPRHIANQADTSACTGFALATTIEYLLDRAARPVERVSGYMLYDMARRYDEWADNDKSDEGSSLRGALKGWSRHGASAYKFWKGLSMPAATNNDDDWWLDSMRRPLGAYFRMSLDVESDLHCALMDVGVLYASALTHAGWDELLADKASEPPTTPDELPIIECRKGEEDGGHAFAIVGYTSKGFIVHNSWGNRWGRGGFAIMTYSDWRQNAMDCWVAQLGVVTEEHQAVAKAVSLRLSGEEAGSTRRVSGTPKVLLSSDPELANHEISPFVVDMQNEGRLSDRGRFRTSEGDLEFLLDHHLKIACERWGINENGTVDVAIYAHGGLVGEDAAAESARQWIPLLYGNRIFPIFLMWETAALSTVFNIIEDAIEGDDRRISARWLENFKNRVIAWKDERIEGLARAPGGAMWRQMKDNANDISSTRQSGVVLLFNQFARLSKKKKMPRLRLHLVGHSAGAIVQSHLAPRAIEKGFRVESMSLLAPALRVDDFDTRLGRQVISEQIRVLVAHLNEAAEHSDNTCKPYGHSLLYLVSRSFEGKHDEVPLLGMEKHLVPAVATHKWGQHLSRLGSPGAQYRTNDPLTEAATHGGVDDDVAVQDAVVRHIKGRGWKETIVRDNNTMRRR
jgi:hypothetical protein